MSRRKRNRRSVAYEDQLKERELMLLKNRTLRGYPLDPHMRKLNWEPLVRGTVREME